MIPLVYIYIPSGGGPQHGSPWPIALIAAAGVIPFLVVDVVVASKWRRGRSRVGGAQPVPPEPLALRQLRARKRMGVWLAAAFVVFSGFLCLVLAGQHATGGALCFLALLVFWLWIFFRLRRQLRVGSSGPGWHPAGRQDPGDPVAVAEGRRNARKALTWLTPLAWGFGLAVVVLGAVDQSLGVVLFGLGCLVAIMWSFGRLRRDLDRDETFPGIAPGPD
ncbi:MAG TPA: hypothetical protein VF426_05545 [Marmoricola sp.]